MVLFGSRSQGTNPANKPKKSKVVVLSLVLNHDAAKTLIASTAAHQINGLPKDVMADTQSLEAESNKQPLSFSSQKKAVGLSMNSQVKALAS